MTKKEFEQLIRHKATDTEFEIAENIYLSARTLTKEQVCEDIRLHPWILQSETIRELADNAKEQARVSAKLLHQVEDLKEALLDCCLQLDDDDTWARAKGLIGDASVITFKIDNDAEFSCVDRAYIRENLQ